MVGFSFRTNTSSLNSQTDNLDGATMNTPKEICFSQSQLTAIADALGHTSEGLTGAEIACLAGRVGVQ